MLVFFALNVIDGAISLINIFKQKRVNMAKQNNNARVVVVGAGMSGLSAAWKLIENGFHNVLVLEARDVIGGRISTRSHGHHVLEIGAQWIHGSEGNPLYEFCEQHQSQLPEHSYVEEDEGICYVTQDGRRISEQLAEEAETMLQLVFDEMAQRCYAEQRNPASIDTPAGEFIKERFHYHVTNSNRSEEDKKLMVAMYNWKLAALKGDLACKSVFEMSTKCWNNYHKFKGRDYVPLKHGYRKVIDTVASPIPTHCIRLNSEVKRIDWSEGNNITKKTKAKVILANGECVDADHVIVTCSLGFLKSSVNTLFNPQLPVYKLKAIQRIGFGTVDKIYLEFEKPFWNKTDKVLRLAWLPDKQVHFRFADKSSTKIPWWRGFENFSVVEFHDNVLCGWIAGEEADVMETLPDIEVIDGCHELLQHFTGNPNIPRPVNMIRSKWHSERFVRGSYSYQKLGSTEENFRDMQRALPSEENPVLLFGGEATHVNYFSTVHGAMMTGRREAQRLIDHYASKQSSANKIQLESRL